MNINFKFLLIGTTLSLIPNITYAQCVETDCLKLGYTFLEKCNNGLKCPFGEYWACPKAEEKAILGECTGYAKNCKIGDILNSDGTCTTDNSKSPLGVVIAINGNCGWVMTTSPITSAIAWSLEFVNVRTAVSDSDLAYNFNVSDNMTQIIQAASKYAVAADYYPAAYAALNYTPSKASATKGKWALPTTGVLNSLFVNLATINNTISALGGIKLTGDYKECVWSSNEGSAPEGTAISFCPYLNNGVVEAHWWHYSKSAPVNNHASNVVRPVLAF